MSTAVVTISSLSRCSRLGFERKFTGGVQLSVVSKLSQRHLAGFGVIVSADAG